MMLFVCANFDPVIHSDLILVIQFFPLKMCPYIYGVTIIIIIINI